MNTGYYGTRDEYAYIQGSSDIQWIWGIHLPFAWNQVRYIVMRCTKSCDVNFASRRCSSLGGYWSSLFALYRPYWAQWLHVLYAQVRNLVWVSVQRMFCNSISSLIDVWWTNVSRTLFTVLHLDCKKQCKLRKFATNLGKVGVSHRCWDSKDPSSSWVQALRDMTANLGQQRSYCCFP